MRDSDIGIRNITKCKLSIHLRRIVSSLPKSEPSEVHKYNEKTFFFFKFCPAEFCTSNIFLCPRLFEDGGGRVARWCWVSFQCRGVLLIWYRVGQGPTALAVGAGGGCLDIFSLIFHFSFLSPSPWETARYRLKYCLKGPLSPNQPTNLFEE